MAAAAVGRLFRHDLHSMVKVLRGAKDDQERVVQQAVEEIKEELKARDVPTKANALAKATYLQMLGQDISWAAFPVIEVMSQDRFSYKRVAGLMASQSFTPKTDILVLMTQLIKKELGHRSEYVIGTATNCLASIATPELATELLADVTRMLTSSKVYIRKKATLTMYKLYLQYPQGLRLTFDNLRRRLQDENPSVVCCAVNVICELAQKNPRNYLQLAPELFKLLQESNNNWLLIKVAKLMASLLKEEPRLARKLLEPLATRIQQTPAKSLMYECISTATVALQYTRRADGGDARNAPAVVRVCCDQLRELVRMPDQNLKYLGLVGLADLMKSHPRVVAEHRDLVLECLTDDDVSIRLRALDLLTGMVTRRNLPEVVKRLLEFVNATDDAPYRDAIIEKVIFMCSRDKYAFLVDFPWYVRVLVQLATVPDSKHATAIADQLIDIAVRAEDARPFAVSAMVPLLADPAAAIATHTGSGGGGVERGCSADVLAVASWATGEFAGLIETTVLPRVLDALLQPAAVQLPSFVQARYVQAVLKLLAVAAAADARGDPIAVGEDGIVGLAASVGTRLNPFAQSPHVEVQERAALAQGFLKTLGVRFDAAPAAGAEAAAQRKEDAELMALAGGGGGAEGEEGKEGEEPRGPPSAAEMAAVLGPLFAEPLRPVNKKAQKKVPVPEGVALKKWINKEEKKARAAEEEANGSFSFRQVSFESSYGVDGDDEGNFYDEDEEGDLFDEMSKSPGMRAGGGGGASGKKPAAAAARNPFLLGGGDGDDEEGDDDELDGLVPSVEALPVGVLGAGNPLEGAVVSGRRPRPSAHATTGRRPRLLDDDDGPAGGVDSDEESGGETGKVADALASIDLSTPLAADERMPQRHHRASAPAGSMAGGGRRRGDKKGKKGKKEKKEKKEKKAKKAGKKSGKKAAAAAAIPEAAEPPAAPASATAGALAAAQMAAEEVGDSAAAAPAHVFLLAADKAVKVSYSVSAMPAPGPGQAGTVAVTFRTLPKSTKTGLDWVDVAIAGPVQAAGVPAGEADGSVRIAAAVAAKPKKTSGKKAKAARQRVGLSIADPVHSLRLPVTLSYRLAGAAAPVEVRCSLELHAAAMLVPVGVDQEAFRAIMSSEEAKSFLTGQGLIDTRDASDPLKAVAAVLRAHTVRQVKANTIMYARAITGEHVSIMCKVQADGVAVAIKSPLPRHANVMIADLMQVVAGHEVELPAEAEEAAAGGGDAEEAAVAAAAAPEEEEQATVAEEAAPAEEEEAPAAAAEEAEADEPVAAEAEQEDDDDEPAAAAPAAADDDEDDDDDDEPAAGAAAAGGDVVDGEDDEDDDDDDE